MSETKYSRRDLLKLLALAPAGVGLQKIVKALPTAAGQQGHIILLVFDAWSAYNVGFLGHRRDTMPNLAMFADQAIVYHDHYTPGIYTVPGTASLLTGTYPFNHRALLLGSRLRPVMGNKTIFNYLSNTMGTVGFAQNVYADQFLDQAGTGLKRHLPFGSFNVTNEVFFDDPLFAKDAYTAYSAFEEGIFEHGKGEDDSLFLGPINRLRVGRDKTIALQENGEGYYNGIPSSVENFTLENLVDGLIGTIESLTQPSFLYFHVFTPHSPYRPLSRFYNAFKSESVKPVEKPIHPLVPNPKNQKNVDRDYLMYDAYIASWDAELARFFEYVEKSGVKQNSHILITSDHGEMFERGESGHPDKLLFQPMVRIPLIISTPGQNKRIDITAPTASIDILPTIGKITGQTAPDWADGLLLPGLGGVDDPERSIFMFDSQINPAFGKFTNYSIAMVKNGLKLIRFKYTKYDAYELYNIKKDPEELTDLMADPTVDVQPLKAELEAKITEIGGEI